MAREVKDVNSFRIVFEKGDVKFMNDYKESHGASIQWFVEKAVKNRIETLKVEQQLKEIQDGQREKTIIDDKGI